MHPPCSTAESAVFSRQHEHSWHGQSELLPVRSLQVVSLPRTDPFPDKFGLNPETTRIETLTEFIESPTPKKSVSTTSTRATDPDQNLDFASMKMVRGRAFSIGAPSRTNQSISVSKSWEQIEGRNFLIEQVDYLKVAPQLQALPKPVKGASLNPKSRNSKIGRLASLRQLPAATKVASKTLKPVRMAKAEASPRPGFVLDYIIVNPGENNYTFQSGNTYLVDVVDLTGTTTIQGGSVIKHSTSSYNGWSLFVDDGHLVCDTTACNPAIITHVDDNSVGEPIGGGSPARTYGSLIYAYNFSSPSTWFLKNLVVKYGEIGFWADDNSAVDIQNCQFIDVLTGLQVGSSSGSINILNIFFSLCDYCIVVNQNQPVTIKNHTESYYVALCVGGTLTDLGGSFQPTDTPIGNNCPVPTAACADVMTIINTPITINLSGDDGPNCQNNLTFSIVSGSGPNPPATVGAINKTGQQTATVVYSPNSTTFEGTDGFNYTVSTCNGESSQANATVAVVPAPVLTAECKPNRIILSWTLPTFLNSLAASGYIKDFQIFRCSGVNCTPSSTPFAVVSDPAITSDPAKWQFVDTAVTSGQTFCYQILFRHQSACDVSAEPYKSPKSTKVCSSPCCPDGSAFWVDENPNAQQLAESLSLPEDTVANASLTGAAIAHGFFGRAASTGLPIDEGVILSSGSILNAIGPNDDEGGDKDTIHGLPGDPQLDALLDTIESETSPDTLETFDACVLEYDLTPSNNTLQFDYIFASEEYPEFLANLKNDAVAIFVDGVNIAWVGSPSKPVCVFEINGTQNSAFFRENLPDPNQFFNLQYDGFTSTTAHPWLTATKTVTQGVPVHIKIVIADEDDEKWDAAVFLKAKRQICTD